MAGRKRNVHWDACVWIRLINGEPGHDDCQLVIDKAKLGEIQIWTTTLALAEVYKWKGSALDAARDPMFEDYVNQDFVTLVQVDQALAIRGRRLCRQFDKLKKANDGVHLASAVIHNMDEFHTTDHKDLLPLNGKVYCDNGKLLPIVLPPGDLKGQVQLPIGGGT